MEPWKYFVSATGVTVPPTGSDWEEGAVLGGVAGFGADDFLQPAKSARTTNEAANRLRNWLVFSLITKIERPQEKWQSTCSQYNIFSVSALKK